ncbi:protein MKS1 [Sesamum alatum]|uniref:Protein MKS1 n=1 Tax=Sesamum alatum TaxID=300844 RepID=A0AAE1YFX6_9LAMI|nr:protein MKS1 [Sesamum alatum]
MDMPDIRSPKRELQGPRPTPLKVRKDSHKIRKPPVAPPPAAQPYHQHPRPPVIIYTVSPKIIHANPNEFMSLVQRLTGPNSTCTPSTNSPTTSSSAFAFPDYGAAISPAARFASIEKTKSPDGIRKTQVLDLVEGIEIRPDIQRTGQFPGILSPNPNTLPPIPPNFFSPPSDNYNPLSFFHDLSPVLHSNRNNYNLDNNFMMPSPSTFIISPQINMPSPNTLDLFHSLFDL